MHVLQYKFFFPLSNISWAYFYVNAHYLYFLVAVEYSIYMCVL